MTVHAWALFCMTETLLCLSPGPSALLVISLALTRGQAAGFAATVGVLAANALYFALSASGLIALHSLSAEVFVVIKWAGAAYLIWLGMRIVVRSFSRAVTEPALSGRRFWASRGVAGLRHAGRESQPPGLLRCHPPAVRRHAHPLPSQVAILACSSFVIEFTVLSVYAALSFRAGRRVSTRFRLVAERVGGGLLVAAGAGLASIRRA